MSIATAFRPGDRRIYLWLVPDDQTEIASESGYTGLHLSGCDFADQHAFAVMFSACRWERVGLARTRLEKLDLDRVVMDGCDLANATWEASRWEKVDVRESRLTGVNLSQALVKDCTFHSCESPFGNFRSAVFKKVRFTECNLRGADFQRADLRQVVFEKCDLRNAQMSFAKLDGTDFRGSEIENVQVRIEDLRGAVVEPSQAAYLAGLMGLKILA